MTLNWKPFYISIKKKSSMTWSSIARRCPIIYFFLFNDNILRQENRCFFLHGLLLTASTKPFKKTTPIREGNISLSCEGPFYEFSTVLQATDLLCNEK